MSTEDLMEFNSVLLFGTSDVAWHEGHNYVKKKKNLKILWGDHFENLGKQTTCLMNKQGIGYYEKETIHHRAITKQFYRHCYYFFTFYCKVTLSPLHMRLGFLRHILKLTSTLLKSIRRKIWEGNQSWVHLDFFQLRLRSFNTDQSMVRLLLLFFENLWVLRNAIR